MKNFQNTPQEQQNSSSTKLASTSSPQSHPINLEIFSQHNTKCINNNQGLYSCIQAKCTSLNPFICNLEECECSTIHFDCNQKKIKSLVKTLESIQDQFRETEKVINQALDDINVEYSAEWDRIVQKLKAKSTDFTQPSDRQKEKNELQSALQQQKLNGSLFSSIFDSQKLQAQTKWHKKAQQKIMQKAKEFQQKELKNFFNEIKLQLFEKTIQFHPKMINKTLERVSHLKLRCISIQKDDNFSLGLIQPSINQLLKGENKIIKWRVKIHFITHWIGIGICLKKFLERRDFNFNTYQSADHGSYIISSNEYFWSYKNKERNFKKEGAFKLMMGDIVDVRLNMKEREITFKNDRLNRELTLKITHIPENGEDEYCITLGMYTLGDEAEILEPIVVCDEEEDKKEMQLRGERVQLPEITNIKRKTSSDSSDSSDSFIVSDKRLNGRNDCYR